MAATEQFAITAWKRKTPMLTDGAPLSDNLYEENGKIFLQLSGAKITAADPYTILFRAATDNDTDVFMRNTMSGYYNQKEKVVSVVREEKKMIVRTEISVKGKRFLCTDIYQSCREGILVTSRLCCKKGGGYLPRFGKTFYLDHSFENVSYCGRTGESYNDMKEQWPVSDVFCKVKDMTEPNIRPQESGNRCDCAFVSLDNGKTVVTFEAVENKFELGIKPYSDIELTRMRHREDEKRTGTYVTINAFQMGIGSGSCGPVTADNYRFPAGKDYELKFMIRWGELC